MFGIGEWSKNVRSVRLGKKVAELCDSIVRLMFNTGNVTADTSPWLRYSTG